MVEVSIVKCKSYNEAYGKINEALSLIGGINKLVKGKKVLIKINSVRYRRALPTVTDPRFVSAMIRATYDAGAKKVIVGEKSAAGVKTRVDFAESGVDKAAQEVGAEVVYFDEDEVETVKIPEATVLKEVVLPKTLRKCDFLINLPKMKTHLQTIVTLGIKNLHGVILDEQRLLFHREDLHPKLVDIMRVVKPDLTVVDGIVAMEGQGPSHGNPVDMDVIVAGFDTVAVDAVATALMGIDPMEIVTTKIAHAEGLGIGDLSRITVKGERIEDVKRRFKRADFHIYGAFKNVKAIECGVCSGCYLSARWCFDYLTYEGLIDKMPKITLVVGKMHPELGMEPETSEGDLYIFGNCAIETSYSLRHRKPRGFVIPGCPPWFTDLPNKLKQLYKL